MGQGRFEILLHKWYINSNCTNSYMKPLNWLIFVTVINSSTANTSISSWKPEEFCALSFLDATRNQDKLWPGGPLGSCRFYLLMEKNALYILTSHINSLSLGYRVWATSESECSSFQCGINSHYTISNKSSEQWGKRWTGARKGSASQGCWHSYS